jgi:hypothetical protein
MGKPEGKRQRGRYRRGLEDNTKMYLKYDGREWTGFMRPG